MTSHNRYITDTFSLSYLIELCFRILQIDSDFVKYKNKLLKFSQYYPNILHYTTSDE